MRSESFHVQAENLGAIVDALRRKYSECYEANSQSGHVRMLVFEKYYLRTSSNAAGIAFLEDTGEGRCLVSLAAAGGAEGMLGLDYGAESQFLDEMKRVIVDAAQEMRIGEEKYKQLEAGSPDAEICIVCIRGIEEGEQVVECPYCGGIAHRAHMREWLRTKDCCPVCHEPLKESELKQVNQ